MESPTHSDGGKYVRPSGAVDDLGGMISDARLSDGLEYTPSVPRSGQQAATTATTVAGRPKGPSDGFAAAARSLSAVSVSTASASHSRSTSGRGCAELYLERVQVPCDAAEDLVREADCLMGRNGATPDVVALLSRAFKLLLASMEWLGANADDDSTMQKLHSIAHFCELLQVQLRTVERISTVSTRQSDIDGSSMAQRGVPRHTTLPMSLDPCRSCGETSWGYYCHNCGTVITAC